MTDTAVWYCSVKLFLKMLKYSQENTSGRVSSPVDLLKRDAETGVFL